MKTEGISASHITVTYRNGHTALRDSSFETPTGSITALVGINGSGKSTLFKAIMGFVRLSRGSITVFGMPVRNALKKNLVAYVPQSEDVDWNFPVLVEDVVMMGRYGHMNFLRQPKDVDYAAVTDALQRVNMLPFRKRQINWIACTRSPFSDSKNTCWPLRGLYYRVGFRFRMDTLCGACPWSYSNFRRYKRISW